MRTDDEIHETDALAARIGYAGPGQDLDPRDLIAWFDRIGVDWQDGLLVYVSRRYDVSIADAYACTDGLAKSEIRRRDVESDPEAAHYYGN